MQSIVMDASVEGKKPVTDGLAGTGLTVLQEVGRLIAAMGLADERGWRR